MFVTVPRYTFTAVVPAGSADQVRAADPIDVTDVIDAVTSADPADSPAADTAVIFQK